MAKKNKLCYDSIVEWHHATHSYAKIGEEPHLWHAHMYMCAVQKAKGD